MKCNRCEAPTLDNAAVLWGIYHAQLCVTCRNDFELFCREQEFFQKKIALEAERLLLNQYVHSGGLAPTLAAVSRLLQDEDENKRQAFLLIKAWINLHVQKETI